MRQERNAKLVIGYDGSEGADRAVDAAAAIFPSAEAVIVAVVEPLVETFAGAELDAGLGVDLSGADEDDLAVASRTARSGAARASARGLHATPRPVVGSPSWIEIAAAADDVGADAIVVGSRGHGALVEAVLGSVSHALARRAGRPVLIVPHSSGSRIDG